MTHLHYYCSDNSKAVAGKCTTSFCAEPINNQTSKESGSDLPNDSDSVNSELSDDLSEGLSHGDSDSEGEPERMDQAGTDQACLHPAVSSGDFGKVVQLKAQRE